MFLILTNKAPSPPKLTPGGDRNAAGCMGTVGGREVAAPLPMPPAPAGFGGAACLFGAGALLSALLCIDVAHDMETPNDYTSIRQLDNQQATMQESEACKHSATMQGQ